MPAESLSEGGRSKIGIMSKTKTTLECIKELSEAWREFVLQLAYSLKADCLCELLADFLYVREEQNDESD